MRRGRPGPDTPYRKVVRRRPNLEWSLNEQAVAYDRKSDGMHPLLTNGASLTNAQVLEAHKGQPRIEKRFQQTKAVQEIAPAFLKSEGHVEALFTLRFRGLLLRALIERELRQAMAREKIDHLPLYPDERRRKQPSTEQVLRFLSLAERHTLLRRDTRVQVAVEEDPEGARRYSLRASRPKTRSIVLSTADMSIEKPFSTLSPTTKP